MHLVTLADLLVGDTINISLWQEKFWANANDMLFRYDQMFHKNPQKLNFNDNCSGEGKYDS